MAQFCKSDLPSPLLCNAHVAPRSQGHQWVVLSKLNNTNYVYKLVSITDKFKVSIHMTILVLKCTKI